MIALLVIAAAASEPPDFAPAANQFADIAACRAHLGALVLSARDDGVAAAEGPYEMAPGDVRAHIVSAEGAGHRIAEYRCLGARLGRRSWARSMAAPDEEFTIDSVARRAGWLKQGARQ